MQGYTIIESAVRESVLAHFSEYLTDNTCLVDDQDNLWREVFQTGAIYACLLDMNAPIVGSQQQREPFKNPAWTWRMVGVIAVRYDRDLIKTRNRLMIDQLVTLFQDDHTLGGIAVKVELTQIESPEVVNVNDVTFSFIGFQIEIWDR